MKLTPGMRISHYEIESLLGTGGMGEVFHGKDTQLNRSVAIKVLPEILLTDRNRLIQFQREAKVLASLNHSNVASIHGFEETNGTHLLVMEYVEGPTLADALAKRALPVGEAIAIAKQIAEGLEYAHEHGVIHRDIKPANIKVRPDGTVKILDFGLAKAIEDETMRHDVSISPTISHHATEMGVILGTAAYMSPEQAKGKPVDRRADIWSFGVVLYEMLTGRKLFQRDSISETLAAVLKEEPDLTIFPDEVPDGLCKLLRRCLMKDPKQRLRDIGDARLELDESFIPSSEKKKDLPASSFKWIPWLLSAILLITLIVMRPWDKAVQLDNAVVQRLSIDFPSDAPPFLYSTGVQFDPDGSSIVYVSGSSNQRRLFIRNLSQETAESIAGSDGAIDPFFSPDGKNVAFFSSGMLKQSSRFGEQTEPICNAVNPRGGVWAADGNIYFTPGTDSPLLKVPSTGGTAVAETKLNTSAGERSHRWPAMLPDQSLLFTVAYTKGTPLDDASIAVKKIGEQSHRILIKGGGFGRYVPTGHIVYARQNSIYAVPFDVKQLKITGPPFEIQSRVKMSETNGSAQFSFADSGSMIYSSGKVENVVNGPLVQIDQNGTESILIKEERRYWHVRYSRNGKFLLLEIDYPGSAVWIYDIARATLSLITSEALSYMPVPSPDDQYVAYESIHDGAAGIFVSRLDGSGEERLTSAKQEQHVPTSWTPDGKSILYTSGGKTPRSEIWMVSLQEKIEKPVLQTSYNVGAGMLSPDGKWLAYVSDESNRPEVYIRPFASRGARIQISTEGGSQPVWASSGKELFYRNGNQVLVVNIQTTDEIITSRPRILFSRNNPLSNSGVQYDWIANYDITPDGKSIVMAKSEHNESQSSTRVILNWFQEILRLEKAVGR